jgi:hypothetical protein
MITGLLRDKLRLSGRPVENKPMVKAAFLLPLCFALGVSGVAQAASLPGYVCKAYNPYLRNGHIVRFRQAPPDIRCTKPGAPTCYKFSSHPNKAPTCR